MALLGFRAESTPSLASTFLDVLVTEVANTGRYEVISKNEIDSMLGLERMKDVIGCDDVSCMAEIGGALGVERMISGSVARLGEAFVVNLQLINVLYGNVENRVSMRWEGPALDVVKVIGAAAQDLVLPFKEKKPGVIDVTQAPAGASIFIDNALTGPRADKLSIGPHTLKVVADGYEDRVTPFVLKSGERLLLDGSLRRVQVASTPIDVKSIALTGEIELEILTDTLKNRRADSSDDRSEHLTAMLVGLEASYRFSKWLRVGLRGRIETNRGGVMSADDPWPSASQLDGGGTFGLVVAASPFYGENLYDFSIEAGADVHVRKILIVNYTLPESLSIAQGGNEDPHPLLGGHVGTSIDYYISPAFTVGLGVRYYRVPAIRIEYNGESFELSASSLAFSPRIAIRF